jgi:O-antigen ligase
MRVLPIGLAIARGSAVLLVGIGLMVVVFASRQVNPWPKAGVGAAIAAIGVGVFLVVGTISQRYRYTAQLGSLAHESPAPPSDAAREHRRKLLACSRRTRK